MLNKQDFKILLIILISFIIFLFCRLLYKSTTYVEKRFFTQPKYTQAELELKILNLENRIRYLEKLLIKKGGRK